MPGIVGVITAGKAHDIADMLQGMLQEVKHHSWYVEEHFVDHGSGLGLGRSSLGVVNTAEQPVSTDDGAVVAVMDGELYDYALQRRNLEEGGCRFSGDSHAEVLLHGYLKQGREFFSKLDGKFAAAIWDGKRRRVIVTNDRFGMRPLYYAQLPGKLLVASEIKAILVDREVSREPSIRGLSQFFTFGQYLGVDTSLEAVRLLPPAGWLVYDVDEDRLSVDGYWHLGECTPSGDTKEVLLDRLDAAFKGAVDRRVGETDRLGLSLSGGLDARSILGVIDHDQVPLASIAMGIEGCCDHRSASQLAALVGCRHSNYVLRPDFLNSFETHLRDMVRLTDGQYLSQCVVMPTLPYYREQGIDVLLRGHAGELMHMSKAYNFSLDQQALGIRDGRELEAWALRHLSAYMLEGIDGPLLAEQHGGALEALAAESLRECLQESDGIEPPAQRISHLFFTQRSRRETALSLVKFGSVVETRVPYLDNELVDLLMVTPPEMKMGETIQAHILKKRRPEFLDVINVNTGTRMGAGKWARDLASLRQKVFAKLRVRGYQPYERLGLWLRRELLPTVETLLLSEQCLGRGVFHPDTVKSLVRQHTLRQRNHTFLIMAMMIFEMGQRMFVDDESVSEPSVNLAASRDA